MTADGQIMWALANFSDMHCTRKGTFRFESPKCLPGDQKSNISSQEKGHLVLMLQVPETGKPVVIPVGMGKLHSLWKFSFLLQDWDKPHCPSSA